MCRWAFLSRNRALGPRTARSGRAMPRGVVGFEVDPRCLLAAVDCDDAARGRSRTVSRARLRHSSCMSAAGLAWIHRFPRRLVAVGHRQDWRPRRERRASKAAGGGGGSRGAENGGRRAGRPPGPSPSNPVLSAAIRRDRATSVRLSGAQLRSLCTPDCTPREPARYSFSLLGDAWATASGELATFARPREQVPAGSNTSAQGRIAPSRIGPGDTPAFMGAGASGTPIARCRRSQVVASASCVGAKRPHPRGKEQPARSRPSRRGDCSDSSEGAVRRGARRPPAAVGFVGEQSSRLARLLVVQARSRADGRRHASLAGRRTPGAGE